MTEQTKLANTLAVILAGGLGTRLRPVFADRPKAMAPVLRRPFVTYLLDKLATAGLRRAVFLTGYRAEQIEQELGGSYAGMTLLYSREQTPLGTAGALRGALPHLTTRNILLLNGDSYCHVDLTSFADFHSQHRAEISLVITAVPDSGHYGQVVLATDNRIVSFAEKFQTRVRDQLGWINAGIYLLRRSLVEEIPQGRAVSLERELLPTWIAGDQGKRVLGYCCHGPFLDIGTPESYAAAESFFSGASREVVCEGVQT
jgi:D-glycero-alpha-D-manno-heptose 1-phosphate guanylyltransferase